MRLDKFLADQGLGSRKEVKKLIQNGMITVNNHYVKRPNQHIDPFNDQIAYLGELFTYQEYYYVLLNKPEGLISATEDNIHETVIDWVALDYANVPLFPVGRLDIDTTGLLLLTNNGQLSHQLLSPKKQIEKTYIAHVDGVLDEEAVSMFERGIDLGDFITQSSKLLILSMDADQQMAIAEVTITEGKYHQVKRMFEAVGCKVTQLHRIKMGPLVLDASLSIGEYRELTDEEKDSLKPYGLIDR